MLYTQGKAHHQLKTHVQTSNPVLMEMQIPATLSQKTEVSQASTGVWKTPYVATATANISTLTACAK